MLDLCSYLQDTMYSSFDFWFVYSNRVASVRNFNIYSTVTKQREGVATFSDNGAVSILFDEHPDVDIEEVRPKLDRDIDRYMLRPEYLVGLPFELTTIDDLEDYYERLLIGCRLAKYTDECFFSDNFDPDAVVGSSHRAIEWLRKTDFFTAPASSRYHECFKGGLVYHTLNVVRNIIDLGASAIFCNVNYADSVFVALVHDWCKIGLYESYMRNVKDSNGNWVQKEEYKYKDDSLTCFGHGVSSMFLAQKFFRLSLEEALAIRWHMGFCRVADSDMNELQQANEKYPLVHMLQFADQLSIVRY